MKVIKSYTEYITENAGDISQLFKSLHSAINRDDLLQLEELVYRGVDHQLVPTEEEFEEIVEYLEIDPQYLFVDQKNFIAPVCYWKEATYYPFNGSFSLATAKMFRAKESIKAIQSRLDKYKNANDYEGYFAVADKKILIPLFIEIFNEIPEDQRYDVFTDLYTRSEYGFGIFPKDIIKQCFKLREKSKDWKKRMKELDRDIEPDSEGKLTIYRGKNIESSSESDAFSWTLSRETAEFFANRFSKGNGEVVSKEIDATEVIDYLKTRGESEIIVLPPKFRDLS